MAAVKEDISDSDLRAKLKENGISYGPITATTKNLYIRKLNKALSEGKSPLRSNKVPSRKSMSPKTFPRRASPSRRSVDPTSPPERKLIGFSSDEDEPAKVPVATRQKRLSGQFKGSPSKSTAHAPIQDEERPVVRRRPNNTSSPKAKLRLDEETMDTDSRVNMNSYTFEPKRGRMPSYTGLRNLFLRKSIEDSKKYANAEPAPEMSYDLEVEDETDRNIYHYTWIIWLLVFVLIVVLLLAFNWKFLSAMLWNRVNINDQLKICGSVDGTESEACLKEEDIMQDLVTKLHHELGEALGLVQCGYSTKGGEMTRDELITWLNEQIKNKNLKPDKIVTNIREYLKRNLGHWLRCVDKNGTDVTATDETFETVRTSQALKPLMCRIREAFSKVFYQLLFLCAAIICCVCVYFIVKYRWMLRERRTRQMFELVDKILEVLKNHHNECQRNKELSPYLAIPHVRDMLIKPSERESMKSAWDGAVKFLSAQESRVRVESQRIAGEDFEVWRLLHHPTPASPSSPSGSNSKQGGKVWQGTAFENFTTAVNPPLISPTPCLKIRNMFEPVMETQNQWHVFIQDAILEKCNEKGAAIVHISVDKASNEACSKLPEQLASSLWIKRPDNHLAQSLLTTCKRLVINPERLIRTYPDSGLMTARKLGCVYVKCANHRSSGAAFRAIHGCWFDGRLVTVKFLTLKRYHQRFPESIDAQEHLKPSGMSSSTIPKLESAPVNESDSDSDS